jgi:alginate O-acetyltransferase complex protein AlgI
MLFNSFHFILFLLIVIPVTWMLQSSVKWRNAFLLLVSYYFYGCWDWRFLSLLFLSTLINYLCGLALGKKNGHSKTNERTETKRRFILAISLVTSLGILGFFKYFNFFVSSADSLLHSLGFQVNDLTLQIVLPIGISFYTFQTLSYTVDVYRGDVSVEKNLITFALYVSFFPQLVAGPIERAPRFLPQFRRPNPVSATMVYDGFYLILWGLFKKTVIADNVSSIAAASFGSEPVSGLWTLFGIYAFAIQIYCDFSGYTDIARGTAKCMGFDLMLNFNLPYFSSNPREFWARWHISLSTWLRDYLYIPLGGNRRGPVRTYVNLMTTMILGGLWHGAAWTFVLWGTYQGALLCVHRGLQPFLARIAPAANSWKGRIWSVACLVVFFHLICVGWMLFRAESVGNVAQMVRVMATNFFGHRPGWVNLDSLVVLASCGLLLFGVQIAQFLTKDLNCIFRIPLWSRGLAYFLLLGGIIIFGNLGSNEFIYFQF